MAQVAGIRFEKDNQGVFESIDEPEEISIPTQEFAFAQKNSKSEFELIGLKSFFDTEDDKNVTWENYFS